MLSRGSVRPPPRWDAQRPTLSGVTFLRALVSLMRLRGMECNSESGYAEAFYSRKLVL